MKQLLCIFTLSTIVQAQQIVVIDSIANEPIPLVSIYDGKTGVIANTTGVFYWNGIESDSLTVSCLGYQSKKISATALKDTLFMLPKTLELLPVMVSNRMLTAEEIIDSVKANTKKNIDFGLSSSEVYVHYDNSYETEKIDVEIKKSTITELDQRFANEIVGQIPKKDINEFFSKSQWLRDNGGLKKHKLRVLKAARLRDSLSDNSYESIETTIREVLKKRVKKDSYFKVKSGPLISVKVDNPAQEIDTVTQENDTLTPKKYASNQLGNLQRLATKELFAEKDWVLPFLTHPNKYQFKNEGITYELSAPVYKIYFESRKKKDFSGYLMIDVEDYGVHNIVYQSNKHQNRLKLFGLFFERRLNNRTYSFVKNHIGKYTLYRIYEEYQQRFGLKRPIKIIEKNNVVKGRNRQNVLTMDFNYSMKELRKATVYFNAFTPISKKEFDSYILKHHVLPIDFYSKAEVKKHIPGMPLE